jgi:hypothetical protein
MTFGYACLAVAPVIGLAGYCAAHLAMAWLIGRPRPYLYLLLGFPAGLVLTLAASALWLADGGLAPADAWALVGFNLLTYGALGYGYFQFVNTNITSLRIRILKELLLSPNGLPARAVFGLYGPEEVVGRRIERLTAGGQFIEKGGRFYLGNRSLLVVARIIDALRYLVLGPTPPAQQSAPRTRTQKQRRRSA